MKSGKTVSTNPLETMPVGKLMLRLAVPSVCAQLISILYSVIDRIYLGHIAGAGLESLSGVGVVVPVVTGINAFSNLLGMGGAPLAAIALGKKDQKLANRMMWNTLSFTLIIASLLTIIMLAFKDVILTAVGADTSIYSYASEYYVICCLGSVFSMETLVINMFLTTQGKNKISMIIVCSGAIFNIIFDPIFIFGLKLGIKGAALVTVISQMGTSIIGFKFLLSKESILQVTPERLDFRLLGKICKLGFAQFFATSTESLVNVVYNKQFLQYGSAEYIAVFSVIFSFSQMLLLPLNGIMQGAQPVISYNYGAKNTSRLLSAMKYCILVGTIFEFTGTVLVEIFASPMFSFFTDDKNLLEIGIIPLRIFILGRLFGGVQWSMQTIHRATGEAFRAIIIPVFRKIVLIIPLCFILPAVTGLGVIAVVLVEPVSDTLAQIFTVCVFLPFYKKIKRQDKTTVCPA